MPAKLTAAQLDNLSPERLQKFKRQAHARAAVISAQGAAPYIVAEGDSWFDYPIGTDILDCLAEYHDYEVNKDFAQAGDTIENMAYGTRFSPLRGYRPLPNDIQDILADIQENRPEAFILSGGGNDVAGDEFTQYINHASSGKTLFRRDYADYMINTVFRTAYSDLLWQVSSAQRGITIVGHGYGYPIPDGRGVGLGVGMSFIGPWLRPALAAKRIDPMSDGAEIIEKLMNMFNDMLASLEDEFPNFHYVDVRDIIGRDKSAWANELHVKNSVYKEIADAFHEAIRAASTVVTPQSALRRGKKKKATKRMGRKPATRRRK